MHDAKFCTIDTIAVFPLPSGLASPDWLSSVFDPLWHRVIPWIGMALLGLPIANFTNGSGDTMYDWVRIATMGVLGLVGGIVWSILDRRRTNYTTSAAGCISSFATRSPARWSRTAW